MLPAFSNTASLSLGIVVVAIICYRQRARDRKLDHIPSLGSSSPVLSFFTWIRFLFNARDVVMEGCQQFPSTIFRIPKLTGWTVIVHTPQLVEDLRKAHEDVLSFSDALREFLQMKYTLGSHILENPYHVPIIRNHLTRDLPELFPTLYDEVVKSCEDVISQRGGALPVLDTVKPIICRSSNRLFVGLPLCRDPKFIGLNIQFTLTLAKVSQFLFLLPSTIRPTVAYLLSSVRASVRRAHSYLQPTLDNRSHQVDAGVEKSEDLLSWLMEYAQGDEKSAQNLSSRILMINTAAIHTTSMALTHALFYLATYPEYTEALREDILKAVESEGQWNYMALSKMVKVDSFIRETQRLDPLSCLQMDRIARQTFTFSDGTFVPPGTHLQVASCAAHSDPNSYGPDPALFQPFRFVNRVEDGRKQDMTSTHADFVAFGHGRHACPGRFFAAMELKTIFAHLVMSYDVKLLGREKPRNLWIVNNCIPNPRAKVVFHPRSAGDV